MSVEDTPAESVSQERWKPTASFWSVYISLIFAMLLSALDQTIVATALPTVVGQLGNISLMAWVITAYTLALTISMPIYGKFGDLVGRRGLFLIALALFVVGSALCGLSQSVGQLIAFRALQGLGGGGIVVLSQAILAELIPPLERPRYMAPLGGVFGIASVLGPLLGGFITDHWSWHWIFWINLPIGGLALAVSYFGLHLPRHRMTFTVDWQGIASMTIGVVAITLLTGWAGTVYAWTSPEILALATVTIASVLAFIYFERRAADPIIPLHLFAIPSFSIPTGLGIVAALGMFAAISYMPTYLQMVYDLSASESGYLVIPMVGGIMLTSSVSGTVISRTGHYRIFPLVGMATIGLALLLLSLVSSETSIWIIAAYLALMGLGLGCVLQVLVLIVQNAVPKAELGTATSANNFFREIGATLGIAAVGSLFTARLAAGLSQLDIGELDQIQSVEQITPELVASLPAELQSSVVAAYSTALTPLFGYLVPLFVVGTLLAWLLPKSGTTTPQEGSH